MIEVKELTKRYGPATAVDGLSFRVCPGVVTGFLGPNGAGKSTTMRMIMGLDRPTTGTATIDGRPYAQLTAPLRRVGALLEARSFHPGRSAYHHLRGLAAAAGVASSRVDEVIDIVGLSATARRRAGGYSLGMGQRLGIATALLADPAVLILDEPVNGLDPEGIRWIRDLMRGLAADGRTVFVSSHLMSEMALTAEHLIVVSRGRLIADEPLAGFIARAALDTVVVSTGRPAQLHALLTGPGVTITSVDSGTFEVSGLDAQQIGARAAAAGITLHELSTRQASLEDAFMHLTRERAA